MTCGKTDGGGSTEEKSSRCSMRKRMAADSLCGICKKDCKADDCALECDGCSVWYHTVCVKIPDVVYELYSDKNMAKLGFYWKCNDCITMPTLDGQNMGKYMEETNKTLVLMQKEILGMKKMMTEEKAQPPIWAKKEIGSLKKIMKEEKAQPVSWAQVAAVGVKDTKAMNKLATCVANKQKSITEDRKLRENNIIIFNMKEEAKENKEVLGSKFENLCSEIDVSKKQVTLERIGQTKPGKLISENPRPIKVCFKDIWEKRIFLSKLRNLKGKEKY